MILILVGLLILIKFYFPLSFSEKDLRDLGYEDVVVFKLVKIAIGLDLCSTVLKSRELGLGKLINSYNNFARVENKGGWVQLNNSIAFYKKKAKKKKGDKYEECVGQGWEFKKSGGA